jgi:hypothetical protein
MRIAPTFDDCPVSEEMLGRIYRAGPEGAGEAVASLTVSVRANIATFCYARAHLQEIGLAIAEGCDLSSLLDAAGKAGSVIHAQSRNRSRVPAAPAARKRAITLATFVPMRAFTVIEGGLAAAE